MCKKLFNKDFLQWKSLSPSEMKPLLMLKKSKVSRENLARVNCNFILYFTELFTCLGKYSYIQYCIPFWTTVIDTVQCSLQKTSSSSSSSLFIIPSFPLLGLDMIWVTSTVFYPLSYLPWCLTSSCLLPLPYPRASFIKTRLVLNVPCESFLFLIVEHQATVAHNCHGKIKLLMAK